MSNTNPGPSITTTPQSESVGSTGGQIGFFGATPVAQLVPAGDVHTPTAGSTTAAYVNTTFDGSTGSTAYTVGDIVLALKKLGLLAA